MGNCICFVKQEYYLSTKDIKISIDLEVLPKIKESLRCLPNINSTFYSRDSLSFSPLSYALYRGRPKAFKYIWSKLGASIDEMEESLSLIHI